MQLEETLMNESANTRVVDINSNSINELYPIVPTGSNKAHTSKQEIIALNRLHIVLQTTIDVCDILKLFFQEVRRIILLEGLSFKNSQQNFEHEMGDITKYCSFYQVQTGSDYVGELVLYHNEPLLQSKQLLQLDRLVSTLVFPLRNGLRYHEAIRASMTDGLTSVGNRICLDTTLDREIEQAHRYKLPLSVLVVDVDRFKSVNDNYGHHAGDLILKTIAKTIQNASRGADTVFRFGGEEFVVLLNNTDVAGAKVTAERLRQAISNIQVSYEGQIIPVTASLGAASLCHGESKAELLERADRALYKAKANGRDRVELAAPTLANA